MGVSRYPERRHPHPHSHSRVPSPIFLGFVVAAAAGGVLLSGVAGEGLGLRRTGAVLLVLGGWAVSLCLHEFGHALVAFRGGDTSVAEKGYLRLDPRRYTDPVLSLLLPLGLLALGGIPLPGGAVWIERGRLRSRSVDSAVSLAGPTVNLACGIVLVAVLATVDMPVPLAGVLSWLALVQVLAFVLNILPVPGLDGWGVIDPYLGPGARAAAATVRPFAPLLLFAVLISSPAVARVLFTAADTLFTLLGGSELLADRGQALFVFWR